MIGAIFSTALAAKSRPNILFMLGDDWGWGDVGAYNGGVNASFALTGTGSRTPTLDALAANGTLFTDFHVGQAYCAPSRASFMSGRWPADLSINTNWNVGPTGAAPNLAAGNPYQLPLPSGKGMSPYPGGLPNVAYTMQQAGYRTAHYGKWHLGGLNPNATSSPVPTDYGFDDSSTYGSPVMAFPGLADEHNRLIGREEGADPHWWSADVGDDIRDSGIRFMKEAVGNSTPFYLHLWWHMSHDTIDPRPEQLVDFPFNTTCNFPSKELGQTTCPSQIFWGAQTWSDKHRFGPVIRAVDELGIRDNTYIIFSTDNGAQSNKYSSGKTGKSNAFGNAVGTQGVFRGSKASLYEGGHRVPFIISGPGVPKGRVDHSVISSVDWLPTIAALGGATIKGNTIGLRGSSMADIWHGKKNHVVKREAGPILWRGGGGPAPCWNRSPSLAIRDGDLKLLISPAALDPSVPTGRIELYNMSVYQLRELNGDRFESQNLAAALPEEVQRLSKIVLDWHHSVPKRGSWGAKTDAQWYQKGCNDFMFPGLAPAPDTAERA